MRVARGLRVGTVVTALMVIVSNSSVLAGDACPTDQYAQARHGVLDDSRKDLARTLHR